MTNPFDMELFLCGVLNGSHATRQRHIKQAQIMQVAIKQRWKRNNPWSWQLKHVNWFLRYHLKDHANVSRYRYRQSVLLILRRLGREETWSHRLGDSR